MKLINSSRRSLSYKCEIFKVIKSVRDFSSLFLRQKELVLIYDFLGQINPFKTSPRSHQRTELNKSQLNERSVISYVTTVVKHFKA